MDTKSFREQSFRSRQSASSALLPGTRKRKIGAPLPPLWVRVMAYLLCVVLTDGPIAYAMPQGDRITSGSGSIGVLGKTMTVHQITPTLSIKWNSFSISKNQTVSFLQPSASSIALNQIGGVSPSFIYGHLLANGQIFLINPSGIVFGKGAQVNVGGLIASTLDLVNRGFSNSGTLSFSGVSPGSITNNGLLKALPGGYIALLGQNVTNNGTVEAPRGTVTFGAGNAIDLDFNGGSLLSLSVTQNTLDSITANGGIVRAEGGKILLSAGAQDSIVKSVVNNTGVLEAQTVAQKNGEIVLLSGLASGTTNVAGTLDASAPGGGNGGTIETSGSRVNVADNAVVTTRAASGETGTWTLDPASFYIGANTGSAGNTSGNVTNYQDISGSELGTLLGLNNVVIDSTQGREGQLGNIYVNQGISWSTSNQLTLNAVNNIEINAPITNTATGYSLTQSALSTPSALPSTPLLILRADDMDLGGTTSNSTGGGVPSGNGTVAVNAGGSISVNGPVAIYYNPANYSTPTTYTNNAGSSGSLTAYMLISSLNDLNYISQNQTSTTLSNNYALNTDLSFPTNNTTSFTPLGISSSYTGYFNGLDHSISNLYENVSSSGSSGGFFGALGTTAWVRNLDLVNETILANEGGFFGGLDGENAGTIQNVTVTGSLSTAYSSGLVWLGGLTGYNAGTIAGSTADVAVTVSISAPQNDNAGGFVGQNQNNNSFVGLITGSVAEGNVFVVNGQSAGGFAGASNGGSVGATIEDSYATGSVTGTSVNNNFDSGGFVGVLLGNNAITHSYSLGAVSGEGVNSSATSSIPVGGFIGNIWSGGTETIANDAWNSGAFVANSSGSPSAVGGGIGIIQNGASYSSGNVAPESFQSLETPSTMASILGTISTTPLLSKTSILANASTTTSSYTTVTTSSPASNTWVFIDPNGTLASSAQSTAAGMAPMLSSEYSTNIATLHQLELMNLAPSGSYTLLSSLNAAATGSAGGDVFGSSGFVRVGSSSSPFTGTFNGQGNVLSNLTINDSTNAHVGLFGEVGSGGTVENLTLANASIQSTNSAAADTGGIAGANSGGTITGVSVTGLVEGSSNAGSMTGGVAGYDAGTIGNAWSGATVAGTGGNGYAGGIAGWNGAGGTVENAYFTGILGGGATMGGIAGRNAGTITTTYSAGVEGYNSMQNGALVGTIDSGGVLKNSYYDAGLFPNAYGSNSGTATNVNGLLPSQMTQTGNFGSFVFSGTPGATGNAWVIVDTNGSTNNAGGTNGALLPMLASEAQTQIGTMHQLELMNMNLSGNYSLAASLNGNVTGATGDGTDVFGSAGFVRVGGASYTSPSSPFTGTFNGNNRSISGLTINDSSNMSVGLFGNLNNATVENLLLLAPNIQSSNPVNNGYNGERVLVGSVAGNMGGSSTISNVGVEGGQVQIASGQNDAGIVIAGVVGNASSGTIDNVYETAAVSGTSPQSNLNGAGNNINVGGIVANTGSSLILQDVYATGKITESGTGEYTGGLLGADNGVKVTNAYYSGVATSTPTSGTSASGGTGALWGTGSGTTTDVYWNSTLTPTGDGSGGTSGGTGISASSMASTSSFSGFAFTSTPGSSGNNWVIVDTNSSLNNASSAAGATTPMLASEYSQNIRTLHQLALMNMLPQSSYQLMNNIDASPTQSSSSYATSGDGGDVFGAAGFVRTGGSSTPFTGSFNGNGYEISNLSITDNTNVNVGLFGKAKNATIENLILDSPTVMSSNTATSSSPYAVGGIAGWLEGGTVSNVSVTGGSVTGTEYGADIGLIAGVAGNPGGSPPATTIENVSVTNGLVTVSSTSGNASDYQGGNSWAGLLVGSNAGGTVQDSYAIGTITLGSGGTTSVSEGGIAGLQGVNGTAGTVTQTYADVRLEDGTSSSVGSGDVGFLVGNQLGGTVSDSYGMGGGQVTTNCSGTCYGATSNNSAGNGTVGASTGTDTGLAALSGSAQTTASSYGNFTFSTIPGANGNAWVIVDQNGTLNNAGGTAGATTPLLASEYSRSISTVHQLELMNMAPGAAYTLSGPVNAAGTEGIVSNATPIDVFQPGDNGLAPVQNFSGVLNGNGQTISNLQVSDPSNPNTGLFGSLLGSGAVADLILGGTSGLVHGNVSGQNIGGLVGNLEGGTVSGVLVDVNNVIGYSGSGNNVGGVAGNSSGLLINDVAGSALTVQQTQTSGGAASYVGGLVGNLSAGLVEGSKSSATVTTGTSNADVGGLGGQVNGGVSGFEGGAVVVDSSASGTVTGGTDNVGGLIGALGNSLVGDSFTGTVSASGASVGGLVGGLWNASTISDSSATGSGSVTDTGSTLEDVGGLVGLENSAGMTIRDSYATLSVNAGSASGSVAGGLVGYNVGAISDSYATGAVSGTGTSQKLGGLVGTNTSTIQNSYASGGSVSNSASGSNVGGLVGNTSGTISDIYASNAVTGSSTAATGAVIGYQPSTSASISNSFWNNSNACTNCNSAGFGSSSVGTATQLEGMSQSAMEQQVNFTSANSTNNNNGSTASLVNPNWSFSGTWAMNSGSTLPLLSPLMTRLTVVANNASRTYSGSGYSGGNGAVQILSGPGGFGSGSGSNDSGSVTYGGTSQGASNAGSYTLTPGGIALGAVSSQVGSIGSVVYQNGTLLITPAPLTLTLNSPTMVYNGTQSGTLTNAEVSIAGWQGSDGATLATGGAAPAVTLSPTTGTSATPTVGAGNVSSYLTATASITASNLTATGSTNLSNYTLPSSVSANTGSITTAPLTVTVSNPTKTYNGTPTAALTASNTSVTGFIGSQGATFDGATGSYTSPNATTGIGVTAALGAGDFSANSGTLLSNYSINGVQLTSSNTASLSGVTGTITPAPLTVTVNNPTKTYNGTATAALTASNTSVTGFIGSQGATFDGVTGSYASPNAATGTGVTAAFGAGDFSANSGTLLSNYSINGVQLTSSNTASLSGVTGTITPAPLTVTLTPTKVYDDSTTAYITSTGSVVTTNGITQTISPNVTIGGFVSGQGATLSASGTYASPNVAGSDSVTVTSETLAATSGTTLSNYNIGGTTLSSGTNSVALSGTGSITPAPLTATLGAVTKSYDGSSTAYLTTASESVTTNGITQTVAPNMTISGFATGQGGTLSTTGTYSGTNAPNAGSGYSVSLTGLSSASLSSLLSGTAAGNYSFPVTTASGTGSITPAPLTLTLSPSKTYDGGATASLTSSNTSVSGFVSGQGASFTGATGSYASPNAASGIGVTANLGASNFTPGSGTLLSNYSLSGTPLSGTNTVTVTGTGSISPANLSATGTQIYNGTTTFQGTNLTVAGVDGQSFAVTAGTGTLASANATSTPESLTSLSGITLSGTGGALTSNYNALTPSQTQVTVSPDPILVSGSMVYNGTTAMPGSDLKAQAYLNATNTSYSFTLSGSGTLGNSGNVQANQNLASLGNLTLVGTGSSNFTPTLSETSVSVTPAPLAVTLSNPTKTYNGTATASLTSSNTTISGFVSGQGASFNGATGSYASANAGSNIGVTAGLSASDLSPGTGTSLSNYAISGTQLSGSNTAAVSGTGTITPAPLSASGSQVYNGTTTFSGSNLTLTGGVDGQAFTASGSGTLGNSGNVQATQPLSSIAGLTLIGVGGANPANYSFAAGNTSVSVTPASLAVTLSDPTKTYDGTATASLTSSNTTISGFVNGQGATFNGATGSYASPNAGSSIGVTAGLTASTLTPNSGTTLSNYQINAVELTGSNTATVTGTGTISPANLSATGTQIYNGTTSFQGTNLTVTGVDGQRFTASGTGTLGNSGNVQTSQPLAYTTGLTLTGTGGASLSNYNTLSPQQTSVTVTSAPILISGTIVYNGTTAIPGSDLAAQGYLSGGSYSFTLSGSGTLGNSGNVQTSQNLASLGSLALVGTGSSNFTPTVTETSVSVTPAPLAVTLSNPTKTYDGTATASLTSSNTTISGFVSGQGASFNGATGSYASANAGSNIGVTAGLSASDLSPGTGTSLSNYAVSGTQLSGSNSAAVSGTGTITPAPLSASGSQVYNGTTTFSGSNLTLTGGVDGQALTVSGPGSLGSSGNVQTSQNLASTSGLTLAGVSGVNPANYSLLPANTSVSVTPASLTLTLTSSPVTKTYDGTGNAYLSSGSESLTVNGILQSVSPNVTVAGFISGQGGTFSATGSYSGTGAPNAGTGYTLSASGLALGDITPSSGTSMGNYSLATTSLSGTGNITPASLTVTGLVADSKVYDGTTAATLSSPGTLSGLVTGQSLTLSAPSSASFSTANVGSGLTVTASGYSLANGTGLASDYTLTSSLAQTTASITPALLSLSTTASKTANGTSSLLLSATDTTFSGIVAGQSGGLGSSVTGTLSQSTAGSDIGGTLSLSEGDLTGNGAFLAALSSGDYILPTRFTGGSIITTTELQQIQQTYGPTTSVTESTASAAQSSQVSAQASSSGAPTSTGVPSSSGISFSSSVTGGPAGASSSSTGSSGSSSVVDTTSSQFSGLVNGGPSVSAGGTSGSGGASTADLALTTGSLSFNVVGGGVSSGSSTVSIQGGGVSGEAATGSSSLSIQGGGVSGGTSPGSSSLSVQGGGVSGGTSPGSSSLSVQGGGVSGGTSQGITPSPAP